jgi:hypothetical protein
LTTEEDYDRFPGRFDDMLTDQQIEELLVDVLLSRKCIPAQMVTFWRQCSAKLKEELTTKLCNQAIGHMNDYPIPQSFIRAFRSPLESRKLSAAREKEVHGFGTAGWGQIVMQTALRSGGTESEWKRLGAAGRALT